MHLAELIPIIYIATLVTIDAYVIKKHKKVNFVLMFIKNWPALLVFLVLVLLIYSGTSSINILMGNAYTTLMTTAISFFSLSFGYWVTKKLVHSRYKSSIGNNSSDNLEAALTFISYSLGATFFYFCVWLLIAISWRFAYGGFPK